MRTAILSTVLVAALGLGGTAFATTNTPITETTGAILVLRDGGLLLEGNGSFVVSPSVDLAKYNEGQTVTLDWYQSGNTRIVTGISLAS